MASNEDRDWSLSDLFGNLRLSDTKRSVAQQEDPCKMLDMDTARHDDNQSKKLMEDLIAPSSSAKIVTRSGRAVRMRLDKKFDDSSSQPEDDDEEYQLNASNKEPNWSRCKPHRCSQESNQTSTGSSSMQLALIYLDLEPPVATIKLEPFENLVLDDDANLKTKIHKFLGLIPRRRKLYNPEDHLQQDEPPHNEAEPSRLQLETEAPDFTEAPIDLTDLPSEKWRAYNCRRHKSCIACLEHHPVLYSFIDSLNPATSIKWCHPQALTYRETDFESCKQALAKQLFNIFNHAVFHCALQPDVVWMRSLGKPCRCEMTIDSSGQRSARLLLWKRISNPGMLIKPLLHEMCHAAAFVFNRETGHGEACRQWACQANLHLIDLPLINVCDARFKYVCSMCGRGSYGLMDFAADKGMLRCHYCQFEVVVESWNSACVYDGIRPDTRMTAFKNFIFDNYQQLTEQAGGTSHSSKMRCLNEMYLKNNLTNPNSITITNSCSHNT